MTPCAETRAIRGGYITYEASLYPVSTRALSDRALSPSRSMEAGFAFDEPNDEAKNGPDDP